MARDFDGSTKKLERTTVLVNAAPCTFACWFNSTTITAAQDLITCGHLTTSDKFIQLKLRGDVGGDPVQFQAYDGGVGYAEANTSAGYSANTWQHACGRATSTSNWKVFLNGGSSGTSSSTASTSPLGARTRIGSGYNGSNTMSGMIAEAAIWSVGLDDAEVLELAAGVSPLLIRTASLLAYWPLIGNTSPEIDPRGGNDMTVTSSAKADHPRVIYPKRTRTVFVPDAAAGGNGAGPLVNSIPLKSMVGGRLVA